MIESSAARKKKYITIDMKYTIWLRVNVIRYFVRVIQTGKYVKKRKFVFNSKRVFRTTGCRFYIYI